MNPTAPSHERRETRSLIAVVSADGDLAAACRRRIPFPWAEVRQFPPAVEIAPTLASAGARVAVLDLRRPTPIMARHMRRICEHRGLSHVPLIVVDPSRSLDFDSAPFAGTASVESEEFAGLVGSAVKASLAFEKAFGFAAPDPASISSEGAKARFLDHIRKVTGLALEKGSAAAALETMRRRVFALKKTSLWEYLNFLQFSDGDGREFQRLASAFTVAETAFFRTASHYHALRRVVIPEILASKRRDRSRIRVWSAGCATGEEPYSIAIAFRQEMQDIDGWDFQIMATDISEASLARAREGVYRKKDVQRVHKEALDRYFTRMGDDFIVDKCVRKLVRFVPLNLNAGQKHWGFDGVEPDMDLIFCENVIIYFDRPAIENLLRRFHNVLVPGGHLFLGYSESLYKIEHPFADVSFQDTFFYRKLAKPARAERARAARATSVLGRAASAPAETGAPSSVAVAAPPAADEPPAPAEQVSAPACETAALAEEAAALASAFGVEIPSDLAAAWAAARLGRIADAGDAIESILSARPLDPAAHYLRALVSEAGGDFESALKDLGRALFLDQTYLPALIRMGDVLERSGRRAQALIRFKNAIRLLQSGLPAFALTPDGVMSGPDMLSMCAEAVSSLEDSEER